jgi:hypothetical protein
MEFPRAGWRRGREGRGRGGGRGGKGGRGGSGDPGAVCGLTSNLLNKKSLCFVHVQKYFFFIDVCVRLAVSTRHLSKVWQFLIVLFMYTKELFQCRARVGGFNAAFPKIGKFFISGFYVRPGPKRTLWCRCPRLTGRFRTTSESVPRSELPAAPGIKPEGHRVLKFQ